MTESSLIAVELRKQHWQICRLGAGKFKELRQRFQLISRIIDTDTITIKDSKIINYTPYKRSIIYIEIDKILEVKVTFSVMNTHHNRTVMENIKGNGDVYLFEETSSNRYIITNDEYSGYLVKNPLVPEIPAKPNLADAKQLGIAWEIDDTTDIRTFIEGSDYINFHFCDGEVTKLELPNGSFKFIDSGAASQYYFKRPDMTLQAYDTLKIREDEAHIRFWDLNNDYWMETKYIFRDEKKNPIDDEQIFIYEKVRLLI